MTKGSTPALEHITAGTESNETLLSSESTSERDRARIQSRNRAALRTNGHDSISLLTDEEDEDSVVASHSGRTTTNASDLVSDRRSSELPSRSKYEDTKHKKAPLDSRQPHSSPYRTADVPLIKRKRLLSQSQMLQRSSKRPKIDNGGLSVSDDRHSSLHLPPRTIKESSSIPQKRSYPGCKEGLTGSDKRQCSEASHATDDDDEANLQLMYEERASRKAYDIVHRSVESHIDQEGDLAAHPGYQKVLQPIETRLYKLKTDSKHNTRELLRRARAQALPKQLCPAASASFFDGMKPIKLEPVPAKKKVPERGVRVDHFHGNNARVTFIAHAKRGDLDTEQELPEYSHFVRLRENKLSPNITTLSCWPYFGDEHAPEEDQFKETHSVDVDRRPAKLKRLQIAQWLLSMTEQALIDCRLTWNDILAAAFHDEDEEVSHSLTKTLLDDWKSFIHDDEFPDQTDRWHALITAGQSPAILTRATFFCHAFFKTTKQSIWQVLRRSRTIRNQYEASLVSTMMTTGKECRLCFRFDCDVHGEIRQEESDGSSTRHSVTDAEDSASDDSDSTTYGAHQGPEATDIVNPVPVNFKKMIEFDNTPGKSANVPAARQHLSYWENKGYVQPHAKGPFYPCHHPGETCEQASCSCWYSKLPCEKFCSCAKDCSRKFQGCSCSLTKNRKSNEMVCFNDDRCACYQMGRECDPDLCGQCGVHKVLNPANNREELRDHCCNANIQRGIPKHTLLGDSGVHGLGLFAGEQLIQHEFIGEYKGEVITKNEAERRGAIYHHQKLSYLFTLNEKQEVDSTYCGNKMRFINHNNNKARNVYAAVMLVNGVHRIALYALKRVAIGQELFFDYGNAFPQDQFTVKIAKKTAPTARNQDLLADFTNPDNVSGTPSSTSTKHTNTTRSATNEQSTKKTVARDKDRAQHDSAGKRLSTYNIVG